MAVHHYIVAVHMATCVCTLGVVNCVTMAAAEHHAKIVNCLRAIEHARNPLQGGHSTTVFLSAYEPKNGNGLMRLLLVEVVNTGMKLQFVLSLHGLTAKHLDKGLWAVIKADAVAHRNWKKLSRDAMKEDQFKRGLFAIVSAVHEATQSSTFTLICTAGHAQQYGVLATASLRNEGKDATVVVTETMRCDFDIFAVMKNPPKLPMKSVSSTAAKPRPKVETKAVEAQEFETEPPTPPAKRDGPRVGSAPAECGASTPLDLEQFLASVLGS